jgi:endogenous inhibitor of DNA gyrase (YacG/DUF329 family)
MADAPSCPICGKASEERHRPFCSERCAEIDQGRWLTERYRLPAGESEQDGGERDDPQRG